MSTQPHLHRFWFAIRTADQWYEIMRECRAWFGRDWRTQPRVLKQLKRWHTVHRVWFEVPDVRFATWMSIKLAVEVTARPPQ